ncbi:MAG: NAD(P)-dependent alcohol dehydrogenase [Sulfurimonadaceae bacterium]
MKAMVYTRYGPPDVLQLKEVEKPTPKDDEVLVKVQAVSINDWDWQLLQGIPFVNRMMAGLLKPTRIQILGCDIAGRVEAVGKNVKQYRAGDKVFGDLSRCGFGGFAEYVCAREDALTLKPETMTFEDAAAIPQAGLLALQGLSDKGELQPGQKVLINGASGGAGTFAVQIAKSLGTEVTGVCSTKKMDFVRSLGADHVIDYTQEDFTKNGQQYDLILDMQAHHSIFDCKRSLLPNGIYAFVGGTDTRALQAIFLGPLISMTGSKKMGLLLHKPNKDLALMIELIKSGKVTAVVDRLYPLSKAAEAMRYFGEGHKKGKIVITMEHNDKT